MILEIGHFQISYNTNIVAYSFAYFISHWIILLGNERWSLNKGEHQYPFSFFLPDAIPPSFEGTHGHVRYTIRAIYQRKLDSNHEYKIVLAVNSIMDLNSIADSRVTYFSENVLFLK